MLAFYSTDKEYLHWGESYSISPISLTQIWVKIWSEALFVYVFSNATTFFLLPKSSVF